MNTDLLIVIVIAIYGPATMAWSTYWLIRRANAKRRAKRLKQALRRP